MAMAEASSWAQVIQVQPHLLTDPRRQRDGIIGQLECLVVRGLARLLIGYSDIDTYLSSVPDCGTLHFRFSCRVLRAVAACAEQDSPEPEDAGALRTARDL